MCCATKTTSLPLVIHPHPNKVDNFAIALHRVGKSVGITVKMFKLIGELRIVVHHVSLLVVVVVVLLLGVSTIVSSGNVQS